MQPSDIRLVFYLPNLKSYRDRVHMVGQIARHVGKATLVTSRCDMDLREIGIGPDLEVIELPRGKRFPGRTALLASRVVKDIVRKYDLNIVHDTFGHLFPFFLNCQRQNCVLVTSQYNLSEWDFRHFIWPRYRFNCFTHRDLRFWLMRIPLQRLVFSRADCIVLQAPGLIDRLLQHVAVPRSIVHWLPNSIAIPFCRWGSRGAESGASPVIRLLVMGGLAVGRGADTLLHILRLAKERKVALKATVLGGIPTIDKEYLQDRIRRLDIGKSLEMLPRIGQEEIAHYCSQSDWLFHLSRVDGSPRAVLESLAQGLPVIGSHHPGIEVLDPDQRFIFFADESEPDRILEELVISKRDSQRHRIRSEAGSAYVQEHFSSEAVSARYIDLYMDLLVRHGEIAAVFRRERGGLDGHIFGGSMGSRGGDGPVLQPVRPDKLPAANWVDGAGMGER